MNKRNYLAEFLPGTVFAGSIKLVLLSAAFVFVLADSSQAQAKCGAEGQRPCRIWERIPSCNKGLKEDFKLDMCVGPHTQVDAKTGKYIPRKKQPVMTYVSLCNRSSRPMIDIAIAQYAGPQDGWMTNGWIRVASGRCEKAEIDYDYAGAIYTYAKAADGTVWDNSDVEFCIKPYEKFEFPNADDLRCPTRDFAIVNMVNHNVKVGNNTISFGN